MLTLTDTDGGPLSVAPSAVVYAKPLNPQNLQGPTALMLSTGLRIIVNEPWADVASAVNLACEAERLPHPAFVAQAERAAEASAAFVDATRIGGAFGPPRGNR